jgi:hypothetical protein
MTALGGHSLYTAAFEVSLTGLLIRDLFLCYHAATRTGQINPHQAPFVEHPVLWIPVGLGCLRQDLLKFLNRGSLDKLVAIPYRGGGVLKTARILK